MPLGWVLGADPGGTRCPDHAERERVIVPQLHLVP